MRKLKTGLRLKEMIVQKKKEKGEDKKKKVKKPARVGKKYYA